MIERWELDDSGVEIIEDIEKFNPYHGADGRFASAEGVASFTYRTKDPKKQYLADRAVQRETATSSGSVPPKPDREQNKHPEGSNHGYTSIAHDCGMTRTDAQMTFQAVRQFTGSHYKDIRHAQRGELVEGDEFLTGMNKRRAKVIENFIDKSPQWRGGTIHRGVKVKDAEFERIQPGAKLNMKGIASWSTDENQAISFAHKSNYTTKAVVFHVDNPGKATSVAHLSKYAEEKEVITSYSNNYRVVRVTNESNVKHAYLKWDSYNNDRITKNLERDGGELDLKALVFNEIDFTKSANKGNNDSYIRFDDYIEGSGTEFGIAKADEDKRLVFGWANIAITADGEQIEDLQKDIIDPEDLEEAVYNYVLNFRDAGEEHIPTMRKKGSLVESVMFTKEKMKAMGIPEGIVPEGWWIGFYVKDDEAWQRIKDGTYRMFSIEGKAIRKEVDDIEKAARGCGVIVTKDGKVLCGTRIERNGKGAICGPGGSIEKGETPEEAARRETMEEFGIKCNNLVPLGQVKADGFALSHIFICDDFTGTPKTDEKEMTDPRWLTTYDLEELDLFPPFRESLVFTYEAPANEMIKHPVGKTFLDVIAKFNPYHDSKGRFSNANGSTFMTLTTKDPKKQHMADKAIARAKERHAKIMPTVVQEKELLKIANKTRNLKNEQLRVVDRDGNVVMEKKGGKDAVGFTIGEARENFAGNITIHNHPDGGTFSGADLKNLGYGASEIRVAAPEGDYIMRNTARGAKPTTGGWLSLQEKLDSEVGSFKTDRQIRQDVGQKYKAEYQEKVEIHAKRWIEAKDSGASQEEQQKHYEAWNKANTEWQATMKPKIEAEVRKSYVDQYHDFYKKNAKDYELEYEFIPRTVKKGYTMEDIEKSSGGEVVLDADFNEKIRRITDEIIKEITGGNNE